MKKIITADEAKLRMADLCARSEQCSADIIVKLKKLGIAQSDASNILEQLKSRKFIDDARYAGAYASDKLRFAGWGPNKIRAGLYAKRIASDIIADVVDALDANMIKESALRAARVKAGSLDLYLREDRIKLMRHLAAKGYSMDICREMMSKLIKEY